jgi:hypothetical protein
MGYVPPGDTHELVTALSNSRSLSVVKARRGLTEAEVKHFVSALTFRSLIFAVATITRRTGSGNC